MLHFGHLALHDSPGKQHQFLLSTYTESQRSVSAAHCRYMHYSLAIASQPPDFDKPGTNSSNSLPVCEIPIPSVWDKLMACHLLVSFRYSPGGPSSNSSARHERDSLLLPKNRIKVFLTADNRSLERIQQDRLDLFHYVDCSEQFSITGQKVLGTSSRSSHTVRFICSLSTQTDDRSRADVHRILITDRLIYIRCPKFPASARMR